MDAITFSHFSLLLFFFLSFLCNRIKKKTLYLMKKEVTENRRKKANRKTDGLCEWRENIFFGLIEKASEHEPKKKHGRREKEKFYRSYLKNFKNCERTVELIEGVSLNFMIKLVIG